MNRRDFVAQGTAFLAHTSKNVKDAHLDPLNGFGAPLQSTKPLFEKITEHVGIFRDVINVGVIQIRGKTLLIDSGEAHILHEAQGLRLGTIDKVLYTHYHRDQCSGAVLLKLARIEVPATEARFFRAATDFWSEADVILDHRYNFRPELMVLRESIKVDGELRDGDLINWQGIHIHVSATPGHTDGSLTYFVEVDGQTIAFTGDVIYGPGQLWEFYSLQKRFPGMEGDYWGVGGGVPELLASMEKIRSRKPDLLVPSHGGIIRDPVNALALTSERLVKVMRSYMALSAWRVSRTNGVSIFKKDAPTPFDVSLFPPLAPIALPPWLHRTAATSSYIQAEDKSIFLFDCGFNAIIDAISELAEAGTISGVDGIWASHYHDDHTSSINEIRRKYGSRVFVQREMQDIIEHPTAYCMPCLYPESIHVDHTLSEGETLHWKGYDLTAYYFPSQTLYHAGLLIEHRGVRVFMTGDGFGNWAIGDVCSYNRNFIGKDGETNGCERCLRLLLRLKPDLLYAAHWGPIRFSEDYIERTLELLDQRKVLLTSLFPWNDPNFGLDPYWIRTYPYRQHVLPGQLITFEVHVFNHSETESGASVELRAPIGWTVDRASPIAISPHTEGRVRLSAVTPRNPDMRRQVIGFAVDFNGRGMGEFSEAIVDYLE